MIKGQGTAACDTSKLKVSEGDIIVVNSSNIHNVETTSDRIEYYCLIVDKEFCKYNDLDIQKIVFKSLVKDDLAVEKFRDIVNEYNTVSAYSKAAIKSAILSFLVFLSKNYIESEIKYSSSKTQNSLNMVKEAIGYIQANYSKPINIDELAKRVGFSKYYFCHVFKEVTGFTVINYINSFKCQNAHRMLMAEDINISEAASRCGFENLSYFTRTFKKHMGVLPSDIKK